MDKNSEKPKKAGIRRIVVIAAIAAAAAVTVFMSVPKFHGGEESVSFQEVEENKIPAEISSEVIPEYKTLERALACVSGDDVYVIVTRGEKPTSGFGVMIDKMVVEEKEDDKNLIVYAKFDDPDKETPISQIITYPICIVKTDLSYLPDNIELRIQY